MSLPGFVAESPPSQSLVPNETAMAVNPVIITQNRTTAFTWVNSESFNNFQLQPGFCGFTHFFSPGIAGTKSRVPAADSNVQGQIIVAEPVELRGVGFA